MENILWNDVKPFNKPEKGKWGIGYGYCKRHISKGYHNYRKAFRQIRKLGFDKSEVWNLDCTIMRWLSDTYGGYFTKVGDPNYWDEICNNDLYNARIEDYLNHFEEIYKSDSEKVSKFILPRLIVLKKGLCGYPGNIESFEKWTEILDSIIESLKKNEWNPSLKEYFFSLWD